MKRRVQWPQRSRRPQWLLWLKRVEWAPRQTQRRSGGPQNAAGGERAWHMPARIVLRFRDGSSVMLDPDSPTAAEIHRIADGWLADR